MLCAHIFHLPSFSTFMSFGSLDVISPSWFLSMGLFLLSFWGVFSLSVISSAANCSLFSFSSVYSDLLVEWKLVVGLVHHTLLSPGGFIFP